MVKGKTNMRNSANLGILDAQIGTNYKRRKKTKVYKQNVLVNLFLVLFICFGVLLTPIFNVNEISVSGNKYIPTDKILSTSPAKMNKNIFLYSKKNAMEEIKALSFVDKVEIRRVFPSKVEISIKECKPIAKIMCGQSLYLIVDKNGKILDTTGENGDYNVPIIENVEIEEFEVSKKIQTNNDDKLSKLLILSQEITQNNMVAYTQKMYFDKRDMYVILKDNIRCDVGTEKNLSYKIKFLKEVYSKIPEKTAGTIEFIDDYKAVYKADDVSKKNSGGEENEN